MRRILSMAGAVLLAAASFCAAASGTDPEVQQAAQKIDELVAADCARNHIPLNAPATDEQFLRRVYLDVAGRIPTLPETRAFLGSRDPAKRAKLIDHLLDSPGYISSSFDFFADLLRIETRAQGKIPGGTYITWIKQCLRDDTPWDRMVYQMLTATGHVYQDGAAGYYLRDAGMPLDNMANTARIFLGTQIGCAQCHDHPFEKWTQHDFYAMAAYTFGVETRKFPRTAVRPAKLLKQIKAMDLPRQVDQAVRHILILNRYAVWERNKPIRLPEDYKYDDAKPRSVVKPEVIFGKLTPRPGETPRQAFARWLTAPDNPRFAEVIANRLWKRMLGAGVIEPVDDITEDTHPANPELMTYLTQLMVRQKFDMKQYLRVVLNTKTYQRQASHTELAPGVAYHFPGPALRRMTAEQVWDSLLTLIMPDPDGRTGSGERNDLGNIDLTGKDAQQVVELAKQEIDRRREAIRETHQAARTGKYRGIPSYLMRASEWKSPASNGHFLREFGQSDREVVNGASADPTVMQVLAMLNGPLIDTGVLGRRSVLTQNLGAAPTDDAKIDTLFLTILTRHPTASDRSLAKQEVRTDAKHGLANIAWALVNTREFLFVQ